MIKISIWIEFYSQKLIYLDKYLCNFNKSRNSRSNKVLIRIKFWFNLVKLLNLIQIKINWSYLQWNVINLIFNWIEIFTNFGQILNFNWGLYFK